MDRQSGLCRGLWVDPKDGYVGYTSRFNIWIMPSCGVVKAGVRPGKAGP